MINNFFEPCIYTVPIGSKVMQMGINNTIQFYVADVANISTIYTVKYNIYKKDGRNITNLVDYTNCTRDGNEVSINYTPTTTDTLYFRFKVLLSTEDSIPTETVIECHTPIYVVNTGV